MIDGIYGYSSVPQHIILESAIGIIITSASGVNPNQVIAVRSIVIGIPAMGPMIAAEPATAKRGLSPPINFPTSPPKRIAGPTVPPAILEPSADAVARILAIIAPIATMGMRGELRTRDNSFDPKIMGNRAPKRIETVAPITGIKTKNMCFSNFWKIFLENLIAKTYISPATPQVTPTISNKSI